MAGLDIPATITSLGTLVAAVGALIVSVVGAFRASKAREAAEHAKVIAEEGKAEIIATKAGVFEVGKRLDGRLSELLAAREAAATDRGRSEGRQEERNDAAAGRPAIIEMPPAPPPPLPRPPSIGSIESMMPVKPPKEVR